MPAAHCRRRLSAVALVAGTALLLAACGGPGGSDAERPSTDEQAGSGSAGTGGAETGGGAVEVRWAQVELPPEWVVLEAEDRPKGWDWAAQDVAGADATVQIAVNGDLGYYPSAGLAMGALQAGPQVGGLPEYVQVAAEEEVDVEGADDARTLRFSYRGSAGATFDGGWVTACDTATQRCVAVQVSGTVPVDDLLATTVAGMSLLPEAEAPA